VNVPCSVYLGGADGNPILTTYKYMDMVAGSTGARPTVISNAQHVNHIMDRMVRAVVRYVEAYRQLRITKMVTEFCQDDNGRIWLVYTSEVLTVPVVKTKRSSE
jgi:hypothetical protein